MQGQKISLKRVISNNLFAIRLLTKACPGKVIYVVITSLFSTIMPIISLFFLRFAINNAQNGRHFYDVAKWMILLCAVYSLYAILNVLSRALLSAYFDAMVKKRFKRQLLTKATECEMECYENPEFYDKYIRAMAEGSTRSDDVLNTLIYCMSAIIRLLGYSFLIFFADPFLFLFLVFPVVQLCFAKHKKKVSYEASWAEDPIKRRLAYPLRILYQSEYAKELRTSHIIRPILGRFSRAVDDSIRLKHIYGKRKVLLGILSDTISNITQYYFNYCYLAWKTLVDKSMILGDCFIAATAIFNVQGAICGINYHIVNLYGHALFIENLRQFMDYEPSIDKNLHGPKAQNGDIVFNNVSFRYHGAPSDTIHQLSLTIHRGEKIAIVGQNGAGKSTLVKLLLRLYDVDSGSITLDGTDIRKIQLDSYRDMYVTVLQDHHHFSMTVAENILLRCQQDGDDERVIEALKKSGSYDFVMSFPQNVNTTLYREFNDEGIVPSGGQAQKIAIAHVYVRGSPVIILDEPTSSLDPISEREMYNNLMNDCSNHTVIIISHRLSSSMMADRVVFLEHGEIVEIGSHKELMKRNGKYATLFRLQSNQYTGNENIGVKE